ncbi:MAG: hypothetical protein FJW38_11495 [Acidobacteria bacterium]|nr:hypothetical protein [Acidobacteriota bacterium]
MQYERAAESAIRCSAAYREAGDLWLATEVAFRAGLIAFCGRPEEGAKRLADDLQLVQRVGNDNVYFVIKLRIAGGHTSRGALREAEREFEEAWNFGEAHQLALVFLADVFRGTIAFLRGNLSEAERWFRFREEPRTFLFGWKESSLFALWAEAGDDRAANAWSERRWIFPVSGQPNSAGAWLALERSVVGLASMGRKEEAAALRPLTEEMLLTGVWVSNSRFPLRTTAGIAAACTGDWAAAEEHHRTAIHQMDTAPYRTGQPMAREWYARMLLDRNAAGDLAKAKELLKEALSMYETLEMPFHANRTSARLSPKFPLAKRGNRHTPNELDEEEGVRRWEQSVSIYPIRF